MLAFGVKSIFEFYSWYLSPANEKLENHALDECHCKYTVFTVTLNICNVLNGLVLALFLNLKA